MWKCGKKVPINVAPTFSAKYTHRFCLFQSYKLYFKHNFDQNIDVKKKHKILFFFNDNTKNRSSR